jgi:hypothetical protein
MACPQCGKKRGHLPGCDAPTQTGRKAHQRGKGRRFGPKDIPKHKCEPEFERSTITPGRGPWKPAIRTTYYKCKTCGVSMGNDGGKKL